MDVLMAFNNPEENSSKTCTYHYNHKRESLT